jgi:hypothetical protein
VEILEVFKIAVLIFTVANLAAMGLESNLFDALKALCSVRFVALVAAHVFAKQAGGTGAEGAA